MKTIHLVFNAHLDPVWLWPWQAGLDEVLNTCETVCGLLERHRDVIFTRGESWVYEQVRLLHPSLFRRIKGLVRRGQWEPVGGWYVQPDCNLPSGFGLEKQVELGREWFLRHMGIFPEVAYNVDSFGHCAFLPGLMRKFGQKYYVMMRPMEHEMEIPARLFRWSGRRGGPEVTAFRIAGSYCTQAGLTVDHLRDSLTRLPPGVTHTMCFAGVGDHGGGPTESLIAWCREHRDAIPGARLEFSSPARFFRAVEGQLRRLPAVVGELQFHAVGCYSVHRRVKVGVRRAEHMLASAGNALAGDAVYRRARAADLKKAWEFVCFNHFHDTLGGTCLPSAYGQADDQLGFSRTVADEVIQHAVRRRASRLPSDPRQRIVVANVSGTAFRGWIEHEPWLEWTRWQPDWYLLDERGREVPHQLIATEAVFPHNQSPRLLFPLRIAAGALRVLRIARRTRPCGDVPEPPRFEVVSCPGGGIRLVREGVDFLVPEFALVSDPSDTWSHGVRSYDGNIVAEAKWGRPVCLDSGRHLTAWEARGSLGASSLRAEWRSYAGGSWVELRLRVEWRERHRLLRLAWNHGKSILHHEDGVPGGWLARPANGQEFPVRDWVVLHFAGGTQAAVFCPDTTSLSVADGRLLLTLLRSPRMADHDHEEAKVFSGRQEFSDRGVHDFFFRFHQRGAASRAGLEADALAFHRPPAVSELTRGMPWRPLAREVERPL